ncbi:NAD(P)-dependent oxidoreductase [Schumannella sp. 10F1B-5-1]|uniref:NAD(P)-dependent oxidoreductase n=1 Tax=Schumannella sp. 10F1B-5-1 TaxID=2590780 RepID=UPI0011309680|nr:NAD(P)H-binding protein [Schumannella sp. 10F1B-5-1]TPW70053.1 NAD-dependent epimerase/dehydratase family protein [Schumannella sp. 10F1B-5-1]
MKVAVLGITGYTGSNIARELVARGHDVTGLARRTLDADIPEGVLAVAGDVHDPTTIATITQDVDAIVSATRGHMEGGDLPTVLPALVAAAQAVDARLGIVGGASSLRRGPDGPLLIDDGFPDEWRSEAEPLIAVLETLRASDAGVDWFFLSPPEIYGAHSPGERTGVYRTGLDELVVGADGRSTIGGEDYAIAFVDELEKPAHRRQRFTVGY